MTKYISWYTSPDEQLFSPKSVIDTITRANDFFVSTKLDFITNNFCSLPIPDFEKVISGLETRKQLLEQVPPELLNHPIFWLPLQLVSPRLVKYGNESPIRETDELFALRVAIELQASELYDKETGKWLDIMNEIGIDVSSDEGLKRIELWQLGQDDEDIDNIEDDILLYFKTSKNADWAMDKALEVFDRLYDFQYSKGALEICKIYKEDSDPESRDFIDSIIPVFFSGHNIKTLQELTKGI